jgi:hypothetical protein
VPLALGMTALRIIADIVTPALKFSANPLPGLVGLPSDALESVVNRTLDAWSLG